MRTLGLSFVFLLVFGFGNAGADEPNYRLSEQQLRALFSEGVVFSVERARDTVKFRYLANGKWEAETSSHRSAWGHWKIEGTKVLRSNSGGATTSWAQTFGIERNGNALYFVENTGTAYEGRELELDDPSVLKRLDGDGG